MMDLNSIGELDQAGSRMGQAGSSDCISRQAAIDAVFSEPLYETGMKKRGAEEVVPAIFEKIKALPSAQPEIIRCGECKNHGRAIAWCQYSPDNAFCSYAERRTDG